VLSAALLGSTQAECLSAPPELCRAILLFFGTHLTFFVTQFNIVIDWYSDIVVCG
jgi:hypothetical protein